MMVSDPNLCIPLYIAAKSFRNEHAKYLRSLGLTFTQFIVMLVLWEKNTLLVKEIGKKLALDSGTLTPVLKKLEEKGYVLRKQSEEDARDLLVSVTEEGCRLRDRVEKTRKEISGKLLSDKDKADRIKSLLIELLKELEEVADRDGEESKDCKK